MANSTFNINEIVSKATSDDDDVVDDDANDGDDDNDDDDAYIGSEDLFEFSDFRSLYVHIVFVAHQLTSLYIQISVNFQLKRKMVEFHLLMNDYREFRKT